jgi:toxin ParE1/3/4
VAAYRFSNLAEKDLEGIADYTVDTWGPAQATRYIADLIDCCERIALNPRIGRPCNKVRRGYRRIEHGRHVLLYRLAEGEILINRILHQSMLPHQHILEDSPQI